jgi:hypothetical protein
MSSTSSGDERRPAIRLRLSNLMSVIAVLALVLAIVSPALRSGKQAEWSALIVCLTLFALFAAPVLLLGLVVILAPTTLAAERDQAVLVVKAILVLLLIIFSFMINRL